jgi:hypothetical protein
MNACNPHACSPLSTNFVLINFFSENLLTNKLYEKSAVGATLTDFVVGLVKECLKFLEMQIFVYRKGVHNSALAKIALRINFMFDKPKKNTSGKGNIIQKKDQYWPLLTPPYVTIGFYQRNFQDEHSL